MRGRIAGSAAGVPGCQRMPVPRQRPRGTHEHSGTRSTGFRTWLTERMEAADRSGGVVNYTITSLLQRTAFNPLHHVAAIRGGMPLPMHTGGMKRGFSAGGPGLVGLRPPQEGGCLFPIGMRLKTRKLSGLWAICEQQEPDTAGGSAHHCRTGLAGDPSEGCRRLSGRMTTTLPGTDDECKCRW